MSNGTEIGVSAAKNAQSTPTKVRRIYDLLIGVRSGIGRVNMLARSIEERLLGKAPMTDGEGSPQPDLGILDGVISALCEFSSDLEIITRGLEEVETELTD